MPNGKVLNNDVILIKNSNSTNQKGDRNMNTVQSNIIARTVFKCIQDFYSDPENVRKFEEWKKKEKETKGENREC